MSTSILLHPAMYAPGPRKLTIDPLLACMQDSLISLADDKDLQEMFDEHARALRMPNTPVKLFRMRVFLFSASEDPLTAEERADAEKFFLRRSHASR